MPACERLRQSFIVSGKSPKAPQPPERALHHPATWQQHEPSFCLRMFDDFQLDALVLPRWEHLPGTRRHGEAEYRISVAQHLPAPGAATVCAVTANHAAAHQFASVAPP